VTTEVLTPPPSESEATTTPKSRNRIRWVALALAIVVALGVWTWQGRAEDVRSGTDVVSMDGLAARYGIQVVVDPDKATPILHQSELAPTLVEETSEETLTMSAPPHKHGGELRLGGTYFFLMANSHNVLQRGSEVTLVMGDVRVEHITVQG
jgi:hypothetical protein